MRDKMIAISFVLILCIVAADGILLVVGRHGEVINRLHAVIGNPERVDVERFKAMRSRLAGIALFGTSVYVLLRVLRVV